MLHSPRIRSENGYKIELLQKIFNYYRKNCYICKLDTPLNYVYYLFFLNLNQCIFSLKKAIDIFAEILELKIYICIYIYDIHKYIQGVFLLRGQISTFQSWVEKLNINQFSRMQKFPKLLSFRVIMTSKNVKTSCIYTCALVLGLILKGQHVFQLY